MKNTISFSKPEFWSMLYTYLNDNCFYLQVILILPVIALISVRTSKMDIGTWRHCVIGIFEIEMWVLTTIRIFRPLCLTFLFLFSFPFFNGKSANKSCPLVTFGDFQKKTSCYFLLKCIFENTFQLYSYLKTQMKWKMFYFTNEKCIWNIKPKFSEVRISQLDLQDWVPQFGTNLVPLWCTFIIVDNF